MRFIKTTCGRAIGGSAVLEIGPGRPVEVTSTVTVEMHTIRYAVGSEIFEVEATALSVEDFLNDT